MENVAENGIEKEQNTKDGFVEVIEKGISFEDVMEGRPGEPPRIVIKTYRKIWRAIQEIPLQIKGSEYWLWSIDLDKGRFAIYSTKDNKKKLKLDLLRHVNYSSVGNACYWVHFVYNMKNIKKDKKMMIKGAKEYFNSLIHKEGHQKIE